MEVVTVIVVRGPGGRGGVVERDAGDYTGGLAVVDGVLGGVLHRGTVGGDTDHAVLGLGTGGHGGAGRS